MSVLTQFYGGGSGLGGTVYNFNGTFTYTPGGGAPTTAVIHVHNLNITNGYYPTAFLGVQDFTTFNMNSNAAFASQTGQAVGAIKLSLAANSLALDVAPTIAFGSTPTGTCNLLY